MNIVLVGYLCCTPIGFPCPVQALASVGKEERHSPGFLPVLYCGLIYLLACLLACLLVLFYLTFANILEVIFTFYRYKFNDNIRDTAQLTEKILRVVLKILDLSFLPILVFSVSAAFRSDAFTQCSMLTTVWKTGSPKGE